MSKETVVYDNDGNYDIKSEEDALRELKLKEAKEAKEKKKETNNTKVTADDIKNSLKLNSLGTKSKSKVEQTKDEQPKDEQTKVEKSKKVEEQPKVEKTKEEKTKKVEEQSKVEKPKIDESKVEQDANLEKPKDEKSEQHKEEKPKEEKSEQPKEEKPKEVKSEQPKEEKPKVKEENKSNFTFKSISDFITTNGLDKSMFIRCLSENTPFFSLSPAAKFNLGRNIHLYGFLQISTHEYILHCCVDDNANMHTVFILNDSTMSVNDVDYTITNTKILMVKEHLLCSLTISPYTIFSKYSL